MLRAHLSPTFTPGDTGLQFLPLSFDTIKSFQPRPPECTNGPRGEAAKNSSLGFPSPPDSSYLSFLFFLCLQADVVCVFFFNILSNFSCCPNWKNWPVIQFCPNPWMCGYLLNHSFYVTDPATSLRQTQSKLMLYYTSFFQKPIENTNACAHKHTEATLYHCNSPTKESSGSNEIRIFKFWIK